jgi:hypothetical protein
LRHFLGTPRTDGGSSFGQRTTGPEAGRAILVSGKWKERRGPLCRMPLFRRRSRRGAFPDPYGRCADPGLTRRGRWRVLGCSPTHGGCKGRARSGRRTSIGLGTTFQSHDRMPDTPCAGSPVTAHMFRPRCFMRMNARTPSPDLLEHHACGRKWSSDQGSNLDFPLYRCGCPTGRPHLQAFKCLELSEHLLRGRWSAAGRFSVEGVFGRSLRWKERGTR